MEQALNQANQVVQNLPGFGVVSGLWEDKSGDYIQTKDPFYVKVPGTEDTVRRQPPTGISDEQRKLWKKMIRRAWYHDRNCCHCMSIDLGLGMIQIVAILPFIGSYFVYKMHGKMMKTAYDAGCPKRLIAVMAGNVSLDVARALVPLLGVILCWMSSASTRNAALFDTWLRGEGQQYEEAVKIQQERQNQGGISPPPRAAQSQSQPSRGQSQSPVAQPPRSQPPRSQPPRSQAQRQVQPRTQPPGGQSRGQSQTGQPRGQPRGQPPIRQPPYGQPPVGQPSIGQPPGGQEPIQGQQPSQLRAQQQRSQQYYQNQQRSGQPPRPNQQQRPPQQRQYNGQPGQYRPSPSQYDGAPAIPPHQRYQPTRKPVQPYRKNYPDGGTMRMPDPNPSAYPGPSSMRMPEPGDSRYPAPPSYS